MQMRSVDDLPPVMTIKDLADFLRLHEHTVRADLTRRPNSLPPRMYLPGRRSVRFSKQAVIAWLAGATSQAAEESQLNQAVAAQGGRE
jgi:predicted DNA-binding transcriptional regulator AlpA